MEKLIKHNNGQWSLDETLEKSAKDNALHRLFRDLAPHANSVNIGNLKQTKDGFEHSNQPHPDGVIGFDIQHDPSKADTINKILENHGHFRHPGTFAEDMSEGNMGHQYGAIQLHPDRAKNLKAGPALSREIKPGAASKVQEPSVGSMNLYEGSATGEGDAKGAKWQGSDPKHSLQIKGEPGERQTRAGNEVAVSAAGQIPGSKAATSGVSQRGYDRVETGKPVKLTKSGQWSLDETLKK